MAGSRLETSVVMPKLDMRTQMSDRLAGGLIEVSFHRQARMLNNQQYKMLASSVVKREIVCD